MRSFEDAVNKVEGVFRNYNFEKKVNTVNRIEYVVEIFGEIVNVIILKTSLTGSERLKPQIRVFTDKILELAEKSLANNERFFCLIHCSHDETMLKFNNIKPYEYIISLESEWRNAAGRIDIRSVYDFLETNPTNSYLKLNKSQHSANSILQAAIFKNTDSGLRNFESYLKFFDSRLITRIDIENDEVLEVEEDHSVELVSNAINKIYFGAPGTGKSFKIQEFIRENGIPHYDEKQGHSNVFRTTLHPEFTYYDFVGQVMPVIRSNKEDTASDIDSTSKTVEEPTLTYKFVPNIFTKALEFAIHHDKQPVFLILEEMSRANVAAVFGDLFQLLDRDIETGESEYRINNDLIANWVYKEDRKIYIPHNLYILGTVNTNDQNVYVMDTAFKRRFEFEYVNANEVVFDESSNPLNNFTFVLKENEEDMEFHWISLYRALNKFITRKEEQGGLGLNEDKQLGQFFIKFKANDTEYNFNQVKGKLLQYLYEDIDSVSYTNTSLFKDNINSFGEIYTKLTHFENVFSVEFINDYKELEDHDLSKGLYTNG